MNEVSESIESHFLATYDKYDPVVQHKIQQLFDTFDRITQLEHELDDFKAMFGNWYNDMAAVWILLLSGKNKGFVLDILYVCGCFCMWSVSVTNTRADKAGTLFPAGTDKLEKTLLARRNDAVFFPFSVRWIIQGLN